MTTEMAQEVVMRLVRHLSVHPDDPFPPQVYNPCLELLSSPLLQFIQQPRRDEPVLLSN